MNAPRHSYNPGDYRADLSPFERAGQSIAGAVAAYPQARAYDEDRAAAKASREDAIAKAKEIYDTGISLMAATYAKTIDRGDPDTAMKRARFTAGPFTGEWIKEPDKAAQKFFATMGAATDKVTAGMNQEQVGQFLASVAEQHRAGGLQMPQQDQGMQGQGQPGQGGGFPTSGEAPQRMGLMGEQPQQSGTNPLGTSSMAQFENQQWSGVEQANAPAGSASSAVDKIPMAHESRNLAMSYISQFKDNPALLMSKAGQDGLKLITQVNDMDQALLTADIKQQEVVNSAKAKMYDSVLKAAEIMSGQEKIDFIKNGMISVANLDEELGFRQTGKPLNPKVSVSIGSGRSGSSGMMTLDQASRLLESALNHKRSGDLRTEIEFGGLTPGQTLSSGEYDRYIQWLSSVRDQLAQKGGLPVPPPPPAPTDTVTQGGFRIRMVTPK